MYLATFPEKLFMPSLRETDLSISHQSLLLAGTFSSTSVSLSTGPQRYVISVLLRPVQRG